MSPLKPGRRNQDIAGNMWSRPAEPTSEPVVSSHRVNAGMSRRSSGSSWPLDCTLPGGCSTKEQNLKTIEGEPHERTTYDIRFRRDRASLCDWVIRTASED